MKLYPTGSITVNHSKYLQKKLQFYLGIGELRRQMKTMIPIDMRAKTTIDGNNTKG